MAFSPRPFAALVDADVGDLSAAMIDTGADQACGPASRRRGAFLGQCEPSFPNGKASLVLFLKPSSPRARLEPPRVDPAGLFRRRFVGRSPRCLQHRSALGLLAATQNPTPALGRRVSRRTLSGDIADAEFAELAIEGGPADPKPPCDLGHAAAIMADGEADDALPISPERAQIAVDW